MSHDYKITLYNLEFWEPPLPIFQKSDTVRIQVRIGPPNPLVCLKRRLRHPSDKTGKTEVLCHSRCGTIKITPCSKVLRAEHIYSLSPAMVTSPYR
jgi:hypothetical protein